MSSGSGSRGGGELYLVRLAEGLRRIGHDVISFVPDAVNMNELAEALSQWSDVTRFPFRTCYERPTRCLGALLDKAQISLLTNLFTTIEADVIHINQQVAEDGLDLVKAAERTQKPWVSTIHVGLSAKALGARMGRLRDAATVRTLTQIRGRHIAVSEASRFQLKQRLGAGAGVHLHVVYNGVDTASHQKYAAAREVARREWMVREGDIVIGNVGRIEAQKDPLSLLEYIACSIPTDHRIRVVWIGDGSLRDELEARAASLKGRVTLVIDGWRHDAAVRLAGFDLFAMPSRFEGLPFALLEAMHAGVPVIASNTDGIEEAIQDGRTGFLCNAAGDWKHALTRLALDVELRSSMGHAGRQLAKQKFSLESLASGTAEVYRQACDGSLRAKAI